MRMRAGTMVLICGGLGCGDPSPPAGETDGSGSSTTSAASDDAGSTSPGVTSLPVTGDPPLDSTTDSTTADPPADSTTGETFPPPVLDECITDASPGEHVFTCGAFDYDVSIPEACLAEPCGLIMDVHGLSMSGDMQDANTDLRELGRQRGYIVIQPNANPAPPTSSWNPNVDDSELMAFMQRVAAAFHVDPDRLHFTGFSQGGFMSWRVVCAYADVLASVAPAAACGNDLTPDCQFTPDEQPSEPVDILYMHGTDDVLVPYPCAPVRRDAVVQAYGLGPEEVLVDGAGYTWTRHTGPDGTVLEFITHEYNAANTLVLGGHCYPGSDDPGGAAGQLFSFACVDETDLHWGTAVIDFFDAHPRGG
jgi:poly(3-hydroxybutyrate) depolymerase